MVAKSLHTLLADVIDYAGLFPPASLPMQEAIHNYAFYRRSAEAWMLGRFICPASRLAELDQYIAALFAAGPPLVISALGGGANDAEDVAGCRARHPGRVVIDVYETKAANFDAARRPDGCSLFLEPDLAGDWRSVVKQAREVGAGVKLRCGGVVPGAFPTSEQVIAVIVACHDEQVPLKFTAGLHHPLRRHDAGLGCDMHGFINVFAAGVFATTVANFSGLLDDRDPASFCFSDDAMRWRGHEARVGQIAAARRSAVVSFGSCSFDEPRDDLRALGWL